MPTVPSKLAEQFDNVRRLVDTAEMYAGDGATMSAMQNLVSATATIRNIIEPAASQERRTMSLDQLVTAVEGALHRHSAEEVAAVPWVAEGIGQHAPRVRTLGEAAAMAEQQYQAALVEWITCWTCLCVVNCADDPATACGLSGQQHVHPEIPGRPGVYGPCPVHPEIPGRPGVYGPCPVHPDAPGDR
ncbi:hypothetical protein [Streptomyces sp. NPDC046976]|uniref:hypothetical protein n=1 Tax=Streptomyces sp. NPDC046976 TaxID=3155258 RepID=UPI0033CF978D